MGWGYIFTCLGLYLGFYLLDLLFGVIQPSTGVQNSIELAYASLVLVYMARSLVLAVQIIFGRRSPSH